MKRRLEPGAASALIVAPATVRLVNSASLDATNAPRRSELSSEFRSSAGASTLIQAPPMAGSLSPGPAAPPTAQTRLPAGQSPSHHPAPATPPAPPRAARAP